MQTTFLPAAVERVGQPECDRCRIKATPEITLFVCSGCKEASYCGSKCQTEAWKYHKSLCKHIQKNRALTRTKDQIYDSLVPNILGPVPLPKLSHRINLLNDFTEAHAWYFQKSVHSAIRVNGGMKDFDYANRYIGIKLKYRQDCGGNPGVAFSVESAAVENVADLQGRPRMLAAYESGRVLREESAKEIRRASPWFWGIISVCYSMEDYALFGTVQIHDHTPEFEAVVKDIVLHHLWVENLQRALELGIVFSRAEGDIAAKPGRISLVNDVWKWVAMTEAELVQMGLPTDMRMGMLY